MQTKINILILGVGRTKDSKRCVLDFAIVDLKESTNRKGFNVMQSWSNSDALFNQISSSDIGTVVSADVSYTPGANGQVRMNIDHVYN